MMDRLKLCYRYDPSCDDPSQTPDSYGSLEVATECGNFTGRSNFWVPWQALREYAENLRCFVASQEAELNVEWGFGNEPLLIRILLRQQPSGAFNASCWLRDYHDAEMQISKSFDTSAPAIIGFAAEIDKMMNRESEEAVLQGR